MINYKNENSIQYIIDHLSIGFYKVFVFNKWTIAQLCYFDHDKTNKFKFFPTICSDNESEQVQTQITKINTEPIFFDENNNS